MKPQRRQFLRLAAGAAALPSLLRTAAALDYPTRPVRIIVPVAAGGPNDIVARLIAQKLSEKFGQRFYVDDIPAGSSILGTEQTAKAAPDGTTIAIVPNNFVINPGLYAKLPYDPIRDLAPVTNFAASPLVLVTHPSVGAASTRELVALLKANPGTFSYATAGTGSPAHLAGELFKLSLGVDITHVPFNGVAPAVLSTVAGHTQLSFAAVPLASVNIRDGKLRGLAVMSDKRAPALADVPTLREGGFAGQDSALFQGVLLPGGTPRPIVDWWYRELRAVVALPDVKERLDALGLEPVLNTPEEFALQIRTEIARWTKVIKDAGIQRIE